MTDRHLMVRPFRKEDTEDIRRICRETCSDSFLLEHEKVLYTKYADYYMTEEPENICILAGEDGRAQGYVLCSSDPEKYLRCWREIYLPRLRGFGLKCTLFQLYTMHEVKTMAAKGFPAHLHIDISPSFQRCGGGSALLDALGEKLTTGGIPGVYLGCASSNKAGTTFYKKYGFEIDHRFPGGKVFVRSYGFTSEK